MFYKRDALLVSQPTVSIHRRTINVDIHMAKTRQNDVARTLNVEDEIVITVHGSCDISRRAGIHSIIRRANMSNAYLILGQRPHSLARQQATIVTTTVSISSAVFTSLFTFNGSLNIFCVAEFIGTLEKRSPGKAEGGIGEDD